MQEKTPPSLSAYSRQKRLLEIGVISFGFVLLPVLQGFALHFVDPQALGRQVNSPLASLNYVWQFLLLLYLLSSSMPRLLRNTRFWSFQPLNLLHGIALALILLTISLCLGQILPHPQIGAMPFKRPPVPIGYIPIVLTVVLAVFLEELLFRVYYIQRLLSLGATPLMALLIAVPLFAIGHQYQGLTGIIMAAILGTVLSLSWLKWRNYWINSLGHLFYNLTVLFLALAQA